MNPKRTRHVRGDANRTARRSKAAATPNKTAPCIFGFGGGECILKEKEWAVLFGVLPFRQRRRENTKKTKSFDTILRMQSKDFDKWNKEKQKLHSSERSVLFHEREIWWCSLGVNIGFEQDGSNELFERPILVVKKFNRDVLWVLPLTRSEKQNKYHFPLAQDSERNSTVILSQLRLISAKRLQRRMHKLPGQQFERIVKAVLQFFPRIAP